jgi:hypothetical protein
MSEMTYEFLKFKIDLSPSGSYHASYTELGETEFLNVYFDCDYTNSTWKYDVYTPTTELNSEERLFLSINNGIVVNTPAEIGNDLLKLGVLKDE